MYCYLKVQNHDLNEKAKGAKCEDSYTLQVIYRSSQLPMSIKNQNDWCTMSTWCNFTETHIFIVSILSYTNMYDLVAHAKLSKRHIILNIYGHNNNIEFKYLLVYFIMVDIWKTKRHFTLYRDLWTYYYSFCSNRIVTYSSMWCNFNKYNHKHLFFVEFCFNFVECLI